MEDRFEAEGAHMNDDGGASPSDNARSCGDIPNEQAESRRLLIDRYLSLHGRDIRQHAIPITLL